MCPYPLPDATPSVSLSGGDDDHPPHVWHVRGSAISHLVNDLERNHAEAELRRRLIAIGPRARATLLRALNQPGAEPATLIGALYPRELPLTDFLIELEGDLPTLGAVVAELRRLEHEDHERSA
jgi:hypothetical protein